MPGLTQRRLREWPGRAPTTISAAVVAGSVAAIHLRGRSLRRRAPAASPNGSSMLGSRSRSCPPVATTPAAARARRPASRRTGRRSPLPAAVRRRPPAAAAPPAGRAAAAAAGSAPAGGAATASRRPAARPARAGRGRPRDPTRSAPEISRLRRLSVTWVVTFSAGISSTSAGVHAEEAEDHVQRLDRALAQVAVAQHEHLLARHDLVEPLQLLAVPAELEVAPERRPAAGRPPLLQVRRPAGSRPRARGRPTTGGSSWSAPGRSGRAAARSSARPGTASTMRLLRLVVVQVERRRLAAQGARRGVRRTAPRSPCAARRTRGTSSRRPGRRRTAAAPSVRKYLGSLTRDMNSCGCRARATCRAVVPALGAPMTKKSGSAIRGP